MSTSSGLTPSPSFNTLHGEPFDYPKDPSGQIVSVYDTIAQTASAFPEKIAITYHDESMTFSALMAHVNGAAQLLVKSGVTPQTHVAVYQHRSIDYAISLLAILKIGAIYTPLDPVSPAHSTQAILSSLPDAVVYYDPTLPEDTLAILDTHSAPKVAYERVSVAEYDSGYRTDPSHLRYAIATSGSTGKPKCVLVHEQSMLLQQWFKIRDLGLTASDNVAQATTQLFDVHLWQILAPLMVGATVNVLDRCEADAPTTFYAKVDVHRITVFETVPSLFQVLLDDMEAADTEKPAIKKTLSLLRYFAVNGETLPPALCKRWQAFFGETAPTIVNMYGPTECGDDVSHYHLCADSAIGDEIPIGTKPAPNTRFFLLNDAGELITTPGEKGILHIAGDGVGPGYLGLPDITEAAFKMHTILGENVRLYNTGDFVEFHPESGSLFHKGRVSNSYIKLDGKRVEPESFVQTLRSFTTAIAQVEVIQPAAAHNSVLVFAVLSAAYRAQLCREIEAKQAKSIATVFDSAVTESGLDDTLNHGGWHNYLPGVLFSERAVRENLSDAEKHIASNVTPESTVCEVGCGSGMLSRFTAERSSQYTGIDISAKSIAVAKRACSSLSNVTFLQGDADQIETLLPGQKFDVIFFNAVINYFGTPEKLETVLSQAATLLKPGGKILIMDVYHIGCKPLLHGEMEYLKMGMSPSGADHTIATLNANIAQAQAKDPDLFFHPSFFADVVKKLSVLKNVSVCLKSGLSNDGKYPNPMVRYRYGVVLDTQPKPDEPTPSHCSFGEGSLTDCDAIIAHLKSTNPDHLMITQIPNRRTTGAIQILEAITSAEPTTPVTELVVPSPPDSIDPMTLKTRIMAAGYRLDDTNFSPDSVGHFDVIVSRTDQPLLRLPVHKGTTYAMANSPVEEKIDAEASMRLTQHLKQHHPQGQHCHAFSLLAMPRLPNGKTDRHALENTYGCQKHLHNTWFTDVTPEAPYENAVKTILSDLLLTKNIPHTLTLSKETSLTEMGLVSIDMIQLYAKINRQFGAEFGPKNIPFSASLASIATTLRDGDYPLPANSAPTSSGAAAGAGTGPAEPTF